MVLLQDMRVRTVMVALATLMSRYTAIRPTICGLTMSAIPAILVYRYSRSISSKG
jgi:hypothetical protein